MKLSIAALALLTACGCTVVNDIDVCDRASLPERELNARAEGAQRVNGAGALAPMPFGGAMAVFTSDAESLPAESRFEIRGTLVADDGSPMATCDPRNNEHTLAPAIGERGTLEKRGQAFIVAPRTDDGAGVVVYSLVGEDSTQVWAEFITGTGCSYSGGLRPVQISEELAPTCELVRGETVPMPIPDSTCVFSPRAVSLGDSGDGAFDFAVVWGVLSIRGARSQWAVRGRVVRAHFGAHEFLSTRGTVDTGPIDLVDGVPVLDVSVAPTGDGEFALLWQEGESDERLLTKWQRFDGALSPIGAVVDVGTATTGIPERATVAAASDGARVAVTWTERADAERGRVMGRIVAQDGTPRGEPFVLERSSGAQLNPAVTPVGDGDGFLFAWEAAGDSANRDTAGSGIRALIVGNDRRPRFANPACGEHAFQLNQDHEGDQRLPALTTLGDGTIVGAWTDEGANGLDVSRSSVRAVAWRRRDLLPVE